jgi:adenylate cyclase
MLACNAQIEGLQAGELAIWGPMWYKTGVMKPEKKLLEGMAITSLITLMVAINILRPTPISLAALAACTILVALVVRRLLASPNPPRLAFSPSAPSMPPNWMRRSENPEELTDKLFSVVQDIMVDLGEEGKAVNEMKMRRELRRRLGEAVQETIGPPVVGQIIEATIVLSDLRGFSVMTQGCSACEVVDMLNRYYARMCEIIYRYGGRVDKFMGDSIMAIFGAPVSRRKEIEQALCCAAEMQMAMDSFNRENEKLGMPKLYMGIGINTGKVVAGQIGSNLHSEYTVIGDGVNLASRIEAYTLRGQILLSESTYERVKDLIRVDKPFYVFVKGKSEPVPLYELISIREPYNLQVPDREARRNVRVDVNLPFEFQVCEGKRVRPDTYGGRILNISSGGMFASTFAFVETYSNIKFRLKANFIGVESNDIYGTILNAEKNAELYEMNVEFTIIGPEDRSVITEMVERIVRSSFPLS